MNDRDSQMFVRKYLQEGVVPQRDIDVALAHEARQAATPHASPASRWRQIAGQIGRYLVALSEPSPRVKGVEK